MGKLLHYFICSINLIRVYSVKAFKKLFNSFFAFFSLIKCFWLLKTGPVTQEPQYELKNYYPDNGKLSSVTGYKKAQTLYDLTIIIPLYNVEKYICECLDSIISQNTSYSYEIIIVNDGSSDSTAEKVLPYLNKKNIKLLSQKNSGQSVARNRALYESSGRYIMFVDGDDILLRRAIQNLMDAAIKKNADIAEGEFIWFWDGAPITEEKIADSRKKPHIESYSRNPKFVLSCLGYSVAKVYKRELWETVRFPEGYIFEDTITKYILRRKANKVAFIGEPVYGYRSNSSSSTHSGMKPKLLDSIWVFKRYIELCEQENMPFDETFYTMAISSLALNTVVMKIEDTRLKSSCFYELCKNYEFIKKYKCGILPLPLKLSEKALQSKNMSAWQYTAETIIKCDLIKKYREP